MSDARRKPVPGAAVQVPSVMNRRMAAALGLCPQPSTAADGLKLFVLKPGTIPSHAQIPAKPGKAASSMKPVSSPKPSRFAHLRSARFVTGPVQQADAHHPASRNAVASCVLNAGRPAKAPASSLPAASTPKGFATPAACVAFILGAAGSGARR